MKLRKLVLYISIVALLIILGALLYGKIASKKVAETEEPKKEKPVKEPEDEPTVEPDTITSVLTGLPVSPEEASMRPFAIMTENTKDAIPQYGLTSASIIYECPVEGGITRLMPIYENLKDLSRIGNVRSCRPYYVYIASEYDAVYVHFGQSKEGQDALNMGLVDELNGLGKSGSKVFYRSNDKKAPHNAYTSYDGLMAGCNVENFQTVYDSSQHKHFEFAKEDAPNTLDAGSPVQKLSLYFFNNKPYFVYDAESGLYKRYEFGNSHIDANSNSQITVKNIILQNVTSSKFNESKGTLNLGMVGSGSGKFLTNGKCIDITWKKNSEKDITHYYDGSGQEIVLNPGKTWISIIEEQHADKNVFQEAIN